MGALSCGACPVSLLIGDLTAAERYVEILLDYSTRCASQLFRDLGRCFRALLVVKRGGITGTLSVLLADFGEAVAGVDARYYVMFLGEMADALARAGRATEGLAAVEPAIDRASRFEDDWLLGELLRVEGELFLYCRPGKGPRPWPTIAFGGRSAPRVVRALCRGSCAQP